MNKLDQLTSLTEKTWIRFSNFYNLLNSPSKSILCLEKSLEINPSSEKALLSLAVIHRNSEDFKAASECYYKILSFNKNNVSVWLALANCLLLCDDLQQSYSAFQQAFMCCSNPKDPKLWYGIALVYEKYGTYDLALDAFSIVLQHSDISDKESDIFYRLACIFETQKNYEKSKEVKFK